MKYSSIPSAAPLAAGREMPAIRPLSNGGVGYADNRFGAAKPASKRLYPNAVDNCNGKASGMARPGLGAACPPSRGEAVSPSSVFNSKLSASDSSQAKPADVSPQWGAAANVGEMLMATIEQVNADTAGLMMNATDSAVPFSEAEIHESINHREVFTRQVLGKLGISDKVIEFIIKGDPQTEGGEAVTSACVALVLADNEDDAACRSLEKAVKEYVNTASAADTLSSVHHSFGGNNTYHQLKAVVKQVEKLRTSMDAAAARQGDTGKSMVGRLAKVLAPGLVSIASGKRGVELREMLGPSKLDEAFNANSLAGFNRVVSLWPGTTTGLLEYVSRLMCLLDDKKPEGPKDKSSAEPPPKAPEAPAQAPNKWLDPKLPPGSIGNNNGNGDVTQNVEVQAQDNSWIADVFSRALKSVDDANKKTIEVLERQLAQQLAAATSVKPAVVPQQPQPQPQQSPQQPQQPSQPSPSQPPQPPQPPSPPPQPQPSQPQPQPSQPQPQPPQPPQPSQPQPQPQPQQQQQQQPSQQVKPGGWQKNYKPTPNARRMYVNNPKGQVGQTGSPVMMSGRIDQDPGKKPVGSRVLFGLPQSNSEAIGQQTSSSEATDQPNSSRKVRFLARMIEKELQDRLDQRQADAARRDVGFLG